VGFLPLNRSAGRPARVAPGTLYAFACEFYWDFQRLDEGSHRIRFDQTAFNRFEQRFELRRQKQRLRVFDNQRDAVERAIDDDIRSGRLDGSLRADRLRQLLESQQFINRSWWLTETAGKLTTAEWIPGKPDVLNALLDTQRAEQVRQICIDTMNSLFEGNGLPTMECPLPYGSMLLPTIAEHAPAFIAAKKTKGSRFPKSSRPSSRRRQWWFLSRALAGALFGIAARTAINLVGSVRPDAAFEVSRDAKRARRKEPSRS
jgi:hypothetical protein